MSRSAMIGPISVGDDGLVSEDDALCASKIACAAADAYARHYKEREGQGLDMDLFNALEDLEFATRSSALRKVKP